MSVIRWPEPFNERLVESKTEGNGQVHWNECPAAVAEVVRYLDRDYKNENLTGRLYPD
ncbi:TPA: hypothetical protein QDA83_005187 [Burkholderia multivorans]|uniref:hypothetical protein n=1 Tax=Burkholderia multivorans TaxID=87883 RepID=UPI00158FED7E|nr:hypothetical protein [Burkholderia multivorans]MBU9296312.1 hypothetical protein [Burkholderia multivorans]MBU9305093.1 hypothetical protein [Burkholderia multivorans]MBU9407104.1 hypothetical protein [Burkholderia multivorans]MBU9498870.1 hypothetical protein [Burkholderia multivorans]MBU9508330.1 hypothetical protein [Burkholderia multivorans]